jgi:multidrug efflux pump
MAASLAIVVAIFMWFGSKPHRTEFFLDQDPEWVQVYVKARGNMTPDAQNQLVSQVERRLVGIRGVESLYVRAGTASPGGGRNAIPNDTIGRIQIEFKDYEARKALHLRGKDIAAEVRHRLVDLPGL